MSIQYNVFTNDLAGGAVDLSTPAATVSGLTWTSPPLAPGASAAFVVQPVDTVTGLADPSNQARATVSLNAAGIDAATLPAAPVGLTVTARSGGTALAAWGIVPVPASAPKPTAFHVSIGTTVPDYAAPVASIAWSGGATGFATLTGLADGTTYVVGVRAANAAGEESNTITAAVVGKVSGPSPVVSVSGAAVA